MIAPVTPAHVCKHDFVSHIHLARTPSKAGAESCIVKVRAEIKDGGTHAHVVASGKDSCASVRQVALYSGRTFVGSDRWRKKRVRGHPTARDQRFAALSITTKSPVTQTRLCVDHHTYICQLAVQTLSSSRRVSQRFPAILHRSFSFFLPIHINSQYFPSRWSIVSFERVYWLRVGLFNSRLTTACASTHTTKPGRECVEAKTNRPYEARSCGSAPTLST